MPNVISPLRARPIIVIHQKSVSRQQLSNIAFYKPPDESVTTIDLRTLPFVQAEGKWLIPIPLGIAPTVRAALGATKSYAGGNDTFVCFGEEHDLWCLKGWKKSHPGEGDARMTLGLTITWVC